MILKSVVKDSLFSKSKVDIIIPFHGQYEKVRRLVESIMIGVRSNPYQITLVDDCSPNQDFGKDLNNLDPIVNVIRNEKQLGFGGSINFGLKNTVQPWVLFLNSDCVVEQNTWMLEMGRSLIELKSKGVRVVTSRNNLSYDGCPDIIKGNKEDVVKDFILEDGFIPLFSFMCHRDLFKHIGGFIKEYPYGLYEDEEFAYRLNHYGYKQAICGKSWIYHEGGATFSYLINKFPNIKNDLGENRNRCINDLNNLR
jgi:GT2 family glycosyltransferase